MDNSDPLFVFGTPRSGVRLVAATLNSCEQLATGPELPFLVTFVQQAQAIDRNLGENLSRHHALTRRAMQAAFRETVLKLLSGHVRANKAQRALLHSFAGLLTICDFAATFPGAQFIVLIRDPRDCALSLRRCDWRNPRDGKPLPYTQDAAAAADLWNGFVSAAWPQVAELAKAGRALLLKYEDFCRRPTQNIERIRALCSLKRCAPIVTEESAAMVIPALENPHPALRIGAIDCASVERWRDLEQSADVRTVAHRTREWRERCGYV